MNIEKEATSLNDKYDDLITNYKKIAKRCATSLATPLLKKELDACFDRIQEFKYKYKDYIKERKNSFGRFNKEKYIESMVDGADIDIDIDMSIRNDSEDLGTGYCSLYKNDFLLNSKDNSKCQIMHTSSPTRNDNGSKTKSRGQKDSYYDNNIVYTHTQGIKRGHHINTNTTEFYQPNSLYPKNSSYYKGISPSTRVLQPIESIGNIACTYTPNHVPNIKFQPEKAKEDINKKAFGEYFRCKGFWINSKMFARFHKSSDIIMPTISCQSINSYDKDLEKMYAKSDIFIDNVLYLSSLAVKTKSENRIGNRDIALSLKLSDSIEIPASKIFKPFFVPKGHQKIDVLDVTRGKIQKID